MAALLSGLGREFRRPPVLFLADDAALVALSPHRAALEQWFRFPSAPWPVLHEIMLKDRLYDALAGVVPVPRTVVPVRRGRAGGGGAGHRVPGGRQAAAAVSGRLARSRRDALRAMLRRQGGPSSHVAPSSATRMPQPGRAGSRCWSRRRSRDPISALYSLGLYRDRAGNVAAAFTSQKLGQVPADFGDGLIVQATRAPELLALGARALEHFGYHGIADIEFKWDARAGVFKLLDINPRPWPWIHLPTACGVNLPYAAYLDALERPLEATNSSSATSNPLALGRRSPDLHGARAARGSARSGAGGAPSRQAGAVGVLFGADDPLVRMFVSPRYWAALLRRAAAGCEKSPRGGATARLETSGVAPVPGQTVRQPEEPTMPDSANPVEAINAPDSQRGIRWRLARSRPAEVTGTPAQHVPAVPPAVDRRRRDRGGRRHPPLRLADHGAEDAPVRGAVRALRRGQHAVAVNSCTAALHLALDVLGLQPGDEVITSVYTFTATAAVILHLGGHPGPGRRPARTP